MFSTRQKIVSLSKNWKWIVVLLLVVALVYGTTEPFVGTMMTNIQHNPKHDCKEHSSREHPESYFRHTHHRVKDGEDFLRFNSVADGRPIKAIKRCKK